MCTKIRIPCTCANPFSSHRWRTKHFAYYIHLTGVGATQKEMKPTSPSLQYFWERTQCHLLSRHTCMINSHGAHVAPVSSYQVVRMILPHFVCGLIYRYRYIDMANAMDFQSLTAVYIEDWSIERWPRQPQKLLLSKHSSVFTQHEPSSGWKELGRKILKHVFHQICLTKSQNLSFSEIVSHSTLKHCLKFMDLKIKLGIWKYSAKFDQVFNNINQQYLNTQQYIYF